MRSHQDDHPLVAGPVVLVLIYALILLRHRVYKGEVWILLEALDDAPDLQVPIRIIGVDDGEGDARVGREAAVIVARLCLV